MNFTESQIKVMNFLKKDCSIFYINTEDGFEKFYLIDNKKLKKVETVRKDNAKKIIEFLKIPVVSSKKSTKIDLRLYSFNKSLKNLDLNRIEVFPDKLTNRYLHSLLWTKRGEYGIDNVIINFKVIECDVDHPDIFQGFSEYVSIEVLRIICADGKGGHEVTILGEKENYSLDYPHIPNSYVIELDGKTIECSSEMYEALKLVKEKIKYFKGLKFVSSVKTLKNKWD